MRPSAAPVTKTKNIEVNKAHIFRKMSTPMVTPTVQHGHCLNVQNDVCHISIGMILPPYPGLTVFHYLEETAGSTKQSWHETRRPSVIVNKTIVRNDPEKEQTLRTIAPPPCRGNVQNTKSWNLILFHPVRHPHLRPTPPPVASNWWTSNMVIINEPFGAMMACYSITIVLQFLAKSQTQRKNCDNTSPG